MYVKKSYKPHRASSCKSSNCLPSDALNWCKQNNYKVRRALLFTIVDTRKRPNTRAKLSIYSTDTYACQTCIIPHTNSLRDVTIRLYFLTRIKRIQYIAEHAPLIIHGVCVWSVHKVMGYLKINTLNESAAAR